MPPILLQLASVALLLPLLLSSPGVAENGSALEITENTATMTVSQGDRIIVVYNKLSPPVPAEIGAVYRRSGFLHPVVSPAGNVVTSAMPYDHAHQNGVFSAWVKTTYNGRSLNFWNHAEGQARVLHERVVSRFTNAESTGFEVDLVHRAVAEPVVDILRERWRVDVYPTDGGYHCFDLAVTQTALTDLPLTIEKYHYGGIALRGPVGWLTPDQDSAAALSKDDNRKSVHMLNDQGSDRFQGNHQPARWVSLTGRIEGRPASIAVLCDPNSFRAPQPARLHPSKPYFCFAPCVDGRFTIDDHQPYQARYRFLITDAAPDAVWLDRQWQLWTDAAQ